MTNNQSDYLKKKIMIARVDEHDNVLGEIERWEAHRNGILHRAFTVGVMYQNHIVCQHRKHPVFDDVFDLTASSHPRFQDGSLQSNEQAIIDTLEREWGIKESEIVDLENKGSVTYKSKDPLSEYIEHEYCYLFLCRVEAFPQFNQECAYGFSLQKISQLRDTRRHFTSNLASWVQEFLRAGLL